MKVANLRLGFATNSSSSHSVVFFPKPLAADSGIPDMRWVDCDFGWGWFTLDDAGSKLVYLAVAVKTMLENENLSESMIRGALQEMFQGYGIEDALPHIMRGYIDHQSLFSVPYHTLADLESSVKNYIEIFADPRVVVYGGNDNSDDREEENDRWRRNGGVAINMDMRLRKDGDDIVMFNPHSGAKIRLASGAYDKSTTPELVDIKITERCNYKCPICYQRSEPDGGEAESYYLEHIFRALGKLGTFEVALGGGETTSHSNFTGIINSAVRYGLVPNFTTYAVDWLLEPEKVEAAKKCGAIGVSVHTLKDFHKVEKIQKALRTENVTAQHVFGTLSVADTEQLVYKARNAGVPLLLLGYKHVGRGVDVTPHPMNDFGSKFTKDNLSKLPRLSVDTAFVAQYPEILERMGIQPVLVTADEGKFSCYIDAVKGLIGASSYCEDMFPLPSPREISRCDMAAEIKNAFARF